MFFRFRCSRPDFRPLFPVCVSARISARYFPPAGLGSRSVSALRLPLRGLSVFAGVSALRPFSAFPSGISARRLGLCYRLLFPVCISARHFPPGRAWFAERFRAPPAFAGLVRFCLPVFCMRLLSHTAKNAPAGTRTLACSAAPPAAGTVLSNRRRLRQRRNPRRTGCKVTYNSLIIAAFTIYSQFLQQRLRSP